MERKRQKQEYSAPDGPAASGYRLPAYDGPTAEPSDPGRQPGPAGSPALRMPGVEDRLAIPEAGEEYVDGVRYDVLAGEAEHADPQCQLAYVVRACVARGYVASTELLTRVDQGSDFATDVCVRRAGEDRETRQRHLEELSFEVANTQTLNDLAPRAEKLVARGVRRLFAVMVEEGQVREWTGQGWRVWPPEDEIRDRAFEKPLRIRAILDAAEADRMVVEALWAKREPHLVKLVEEGREEGRVEGLAEAVLRALERHGLTVPARGRRALSACHDRDRLMRWLDAALEPETATRLVAELSDEG